MAFNFTQLAEMMNPQAPQPAPMAQQAAAQQAAAELEFQQMLAKIREHQEAQRQAQLAETSQQFDPIIERMRGNVETATQPVPQGSRLGDLGEIIANAFYTARFNERLKTPYERRQAEAGTRQQQEMNALAQMRLMMEGKSKAEDRINQSYDDRTKAEIDAMSKAMKSKQDWEKWEKNFGRQMMAENRLQGNAAVMAAGEARRAETYKNTPEGAAAELYKANVPNIPINSVEGQRIYSQFVRKIQEDRQAGKDGAYQVKAGATGEPELVYVPPARAKLGELPLPTSGGVYQPSQKPQAIPAPAPPAPGNSVPASAAWGKATEVPVSPTASKKYNYYERIFTDVPLVTRRNKTYQPGVQGSDAFKKMSFNKERASEGRGTLDSFAKVVEGGHLKFLSAWDFSKFFDLAAGAFFDPTAGAVTADRLRNAMTEAAASNPNATAQDVRKWETLPDSVMELYMKLGSSLNQYIKNMTGVAASSKEFGRLTMVAPSRIDSPSTLAFKLTYNTMASAINQAEVGGFEVNGKDLYKVFKDSGTPFERFVSDLANSFKDGILTGSVDRNDISAFLNEPVFLQAAVLYDKAYQSGGPEEAAKITERLAQRFATKKDILTKTKEKHQSRDLFERVRK
jgi:hypothetical protein